MRYFLAWMLLFSLPSSQAAASECVLEIVETHSFTADDGEFPPGCARATGGVELLIELTGRANARRLEGQPRSPRTHRATAPVSRRPPSLLTGRMALALEIDALCRESSFLVYLPYHANPPPIVS